jgi:hypothetical protein
VIKPPIAFEGEADTKEDVDMQNQEIELTEEDIAARIKF